MKPDKCPNCKRKESDQQCEHGYWSFTEFNTCLICGKHDSFETTTFGYPSKYDGLCICSKCTKLYLEPAIEWAIKKRNRNDH